MTPDTLPASFLVPEVGWDRAPVESGGPGWWAGNTRVFRGRAGERSYILKVPREHRAEIMPFDASAAMAAALDEAGLGPEVLAADGGATITADLSPTCRVANYARIRSAGALDAVVGLHRSVAGLPTRLPYLSIVDEIRRLRSALVALDMELPDGAAPVLATAVRLMPLLAESAAGSPETAPTIGDASTTNLMLDEGGGILAVGTTMSAAMDRAYVAGALINELSPYFAEPRAVFELFWGSWDPAAYARARLFGVLDDLRWACVSRIATARTTDTGFVASLYGNLRIRHATTVLGDPDFDRWRRAA
jgi:hypothetical protein